jgi:hypothetical protein
MLDVLLLWLADEARSAAVCGVQGAGRWWAPQAAQIAVAVVIGVVQSRIQQLSFECCWHSYLACCCGGHVCWRYTALQLAVTLLVLRQCELKLVYVPAASLGTLQVQQVWCEA